MGCDGGSIPTRCELVKTKEKAQQKDPNEMRKIRYFSCAISKENLKEPVVACELGNLYNKEIVIECLLEKKIPPSFSHIRSLKDVQTVKFTPNPSYTSDSDSSPYTCPITVFEYGGKHKFVVLRPCGCVVSQQALEQVPSTDCINCGQPLQVQKTISLGLNEEEQNLLRVLIEERLPQEKKTKKAKKNEEKVVKDKNDKTRDSKNTDVKEQKTEVKEKKRKHSSSSSSSKKQKQEQDIPSFLDPTLVDRTIYSSIFTSSLFEKNAGARETFLCRNVSRI